ncbi:hypothetical protein OsI_25745 [Oryza sativa Indica Group]|uniref:Uncharacterized protein n=1 Tax=Oryza sativa subsp. indica TaxID=39946 RepID=B8B5G0_ORYSI|nr:hypothetical protein OsI_25745 [Oryza sativa Indica Group]
MEVRSATLALTGAFAGELETAVCPQEEGHSPEAEVMEGIRASATKEGGSLEP